MKTILNPTQSEKAASIKMLVLDVDGVLSNGQLVFNNDGMESKAFNVKDGLGIKMLQQAGVIVAIITGRSSHIVAQRAASLGISHVVQGREDKGTALKTLCAELGLQMQDCAYMGDDLPDLSALMQVGFATAPANAHAEVLARVDFASQFAGGEAAVRELCDGILQAKGAYERLIQDFLV